MAITKISPSVVDFDAGITISTTDNSTNLTLSSTDADANGGPILDFYRNSSSPADNDVLFQSNIYAENDADEKVAYGYINTFATDVSNGSESMKLNLNMYSAGTALNRFELSSSETVFNQDSGNIDFRVESDGNTHRLFVDAGQDTVLLGTTASRNLSGVVPALFQEGTSFNLASLGLVANTNAANGAYLFIGSSRGTSNGSSTVLQNGDQIGGIYFQGADGTDMQTAAAYIDCIIYGDAGSNDMPGALRFFTTPDGAGTPTEKMRIMPSGGITFNGDTSTNNALDDYEEGTWTPGSVTGTIGTISHANYTKIGRLVHVTCVVEAFSDTSTNASITLTNLPFPVYRDQAAGSLFGIQSSETGAVVTYANTNEYLFFYTISANGTWNTMTHAELNSGHAFYVQATYQAE